MTGNETHGAGMMTHVASSQHADPPAPRPQMAPPPRTPVETVANDRPAVGPSETGLKPTNAAAGAGPKLLIDPPSPSRINDNRFWTLFVTAFRLRCPVCKQGRTFPRWLEMATHCPVCHTQIVREPGYLLGSIYFNYGATGTLTVILYLVLHYRIGWSNGVVMPLLLAFALLFPVFFFRYARSSWLVFDQYFHPRRPPES